MSQEIVKSAPDLGATPAERFMQEVDGRFHNDPPDRWKDSSHVHNAGTNPVTHLNQA